MYYFEGAENILDFLIRAVKNVSSNRFDAEKNIFELAKSEKYPKQVVDLAESFGMMVVKLEARELQLEKTIEELQKINPKLQEELQKQQESAEELRRHRNELEDRVRERRGEILKANHKLQMEVLTRKNIEEDREQLIVELTEAITRLKQLKGLLPICPSCKKIRDDKGYWNELEIYLSKHSDAEFSHGICRNCLKKLYPEQYQRMIEKGKLAPER